MNCVHCQRPLTDGYFKLTRVAKSGVEAPPIHACSLTCLGRFCVREATARVSMGVMMAKSAVGGIIEQIKRGGR